MELSLLLRIGLISLGAGYIVTLAYRHFAHRGNEGRFSRRGAGPSGLGDANATALEDRIAKWDSYQLVSVIIFFGSLAIVVLAWTIGLRFRWIVFGLFGLAIGAIAGFLISITAKTWIEVKQILDVEQDE